MVSITQEIAHIASPIGFLRLKLVSGLIERIDFLDSLQQPALESVKSTVMFALINKFDSYFKSPIHFSIKRHPTGTVFQNKVWQLICKIPLGSTSTYGELAQQLGSSAQAVGNACRSNPCPIVVPCHRVVAKSGLGGFSGATEGPRMDMKVWLLEHEQIQV